MAIGTPTVGTVTERPSEATTAVPYPTVVGVGDCLVLWGSLNSSSPTSTTLPAGWTQVVQATNTGGTVAPSIFVAIRPNAAGTEGGTSLTVTHGNSVSIWQILSFPGVDTTTPQDVAASTSDTTTGSTSITTPGVTVATTGAALVYVVAAGGTATTATPPTGYTETGDRSTGSRFAECSYRLGAATGATGSVTATASVSAKSLGVLLALRPATAAVKQGSATGSSSWLGSATGQAILAGAAAGVLVWSGVASGTTTTTGTATGTTAYVGTATGTSVAPLPRVTRTASALQVNGVTRRFAGANSYDLVLTDNTRSAGVATIPSLTTVKAALDAHVMMNHAVVRVHTLGINYGNAESNNPPTIMPTPGTYNETAFVAADNVIAEARRRGLYLVVPMADRWNFYHGGGLTFAKMVLGSGGTLNDFYTNTSVKTAFKAYLSTWLNRVNTVTGVTYKDDTTILALELGNEMYDAPAAWASEMAAHVKGIAPTLLVADPTAASGKYVTDSNVALTDTNIDIFGGHFYPRDHWHLDSDAAAVAAAGKVYMAGEWDWTTTPQDGVTNTGSNATRAEWLTQIEGDSRIAVSTWWDLLVPASGVHRDGYELYVPPESGNTEQAAGYTALTAHALTVNSTTKVGSGSGTTTWVGSAAGSAATSGNGTGATSWVGVTSGSRSTAGTAAGSSAWVGAATGATATSGTAAGSTGYVGSATGSSSRTGSATGATSWAGVATGQTSCSGAATGATAWLGTASGQTSTSGAATGTTSWVGLASGSRTTSGSATGSTAYVGTGSGTTTASGAGSGSTSWLGAANGTAPVVGSANGSGSGTTSWVGIAAGTTSTSGSASGTTSWIGLSSGSAVKAGGASGSTAWVGTSAGTAPAVGMANGSGAGTVTWTGASSGATLTGGTAAGSTSWAGAAAGTAPPEASNGGTAAGALSWVGTATGSTSPSGASSGTVAYLGAATGARGSAGTASGTLAWAGAASGLTSVTAPILPHGALTLTIPTSSLSLASASSLTLTTPPSSLALDGAGTSLTVTTPVPALRLD